MKIKILVDAHVFDVSYQGTTTYLSGLYSALVLNIDFEITLAAYDIEGLKEKFPHPGFKFIQLTSRSKLKRLAIEIPAIIEKNKFHYAHFQYITPIIKNCRIINTIHDLLFMDFPLYFPFSYRLTKNFLFRYSAKRSDVICTVSEYSKQALLKHFHLDQKKILVTPNAVDVFHGKEIDVKHKYDLGNYILFVSRVEPRKNHFLLLKTYLELGLYNKGLQLIFVGRTKDVAAKQYTDLLNSLPGDVAKHIFHFENIPYAELYSFYRQAEVFVYPSFAEGFGIPPLEAAIMNCKVLCSNQTAMQDFTFFEDYMFNPYDEKEFADKLLKLLSDTRYPFDKIKNSTLKAYNWQKISGVLAEGLKRDFDLHLK